MFLDKLYETDFGCEFFDQKQASVRRKIAATPINFDFLVAFKSPFSIHFLDET